MAEKSGSDEKSIELRQKIARSRELVVRDMGGMRYELDFPLKLRKSFQRHSGIWISAVTLLGTLFTIRPSGRKKTLALTAGKSGQAKKGAEQKKGLMVAGLAMGGLRLVATLLRPLVVAFLTKKVKGYAGRVK